MVRCHGNDSDHPPPETLVVPMPFPNPQTNPSASQARFLSSFSQRVFFSPYIESPSHSARKPAVVVFVPTPLPSKTCQPLPCPCPPPLGLGLAQGGSLCLQACAIGGLPLVAVFVLFVGLVGFTLGLRVHVFAWPSKCRISRVSHSQRC